MSIKIERWIEKSGIDYYVAFIKAWIPFNAWYMTEFYDEDANITTDKAILDKIKQEHNLFKSKIKSLLTALGEESEEFKTSAKVIGTPSCFERQKPVICQYLHICQYHNYPY